MYSPSVSGLSSAWRSVVDPFLGSEEGRTLLADLTELEKNGKTIQPGPAEVFSALVACPDPAAVKVVILGQDPYPTAGVPHGLSFSIRSATTTIPASLKNIYKEMTTDIGGCPTTGNLSVWASQGVLLLNDVLTVTVGAPQSHAGLGWETLTEAVLAAVLLAAPHVVVIAWGRSAQKKLVKEPIKSLLSIPQFPPHTVLIGVHPSPLSAHAGFFGSRPFSKTNAALVEHGQEPIRWF